MVAPNQKRPNITRENLESHGIYYSDDFHPPPRIILPAHVNAVRETLLSFEACLPGELRGHEGWKETLQEEFAKYTQDKSGDLNLQPSDEAWITPLPHEKKDEDRSLLWKAGQMNLKQSIKVADIARKKKGESENTWDVFWQEHTFTKANERLCELPGFHPTLDNWSLEGDRCWNEFTALKSAVPELTPRTDPKPDLTYGFPILGTSESEPRGLEKDDFVQCFFAASLESLLQKGIICAPTTGLRIWAKTGRKEFDNKDATCFPWAIVEYKRDIDENDPSIKEKSFPERCYCQAANASAAALEMRASLYAYVFNDDFSKLPPIISFTCVGSTVRLWLTYYTGKDKEGKHTRQMVCIWATSVRLTWGVAALHEIILNMHRWVSRLLKPKVQAWVFQALQKPLPRLQTSTATQTNTATQTDTATQTSIATQTKIAIQGNACTPKRDRQHDQINATPSESIPETSKGNVSMLTPAENPNTNLSPSPEKPRKHILTPRSRLKSKPSDLEHSMGSKLESCAKLEPSDSSDSPVKSKGPTNCLPQVESDLNAQQLDRVMTVSNSRPPKERQQSDHKDTIDELSQSTGSTDLQDSRRDDRSTDENGKHDNKFDASQYMNSQFDFSCKPPDTALSESEPPQTSVAERSPARKSNSIHTAKVSESKHVSGLAPKSPLKIWSAEVLHSLFGPDYQRVSGDASRSSPKKHEANSSTKDDSPNLQSHVKQRPFERMKVRPASSDSQISEGAECSLGQNSTENRDEKSQPSHHPKPVQSMGHSLDEPITKNPINGALPQVPAPALQNKNHGEDKNSETPWKTKVVDRKNGQIMAGHQEGPYLEAYSMHGNGGFTRAKSENDLRSLSQGKDSKDEAPPDPESPDGIDSDCKELELMSGREVAQTPYLKIIFAGRTLAEQIDMIEAVWGFHFERKTSPPKQRLESRSVESRWRIFQNFLSRRSQKDWSKILLANSLDIGKEDQHLLAIEALDLTQANKCKKGKAVDT